MVIATPNELNFEMDVTILISIKTGIVASEDERPEYLLDSADGISLKIGVDHAGFNPDNWKYKNDYLLIIEEFNEDGLKNNYFYFESTKLDSVLRFAVRNYKKIATAKCSPSDDFLDLYAALIEATIVSDGEVMDASLKYLDEKVGYGMYRHGGGDLEGEFIYEATTNDGKAPLAFCWIKSNTILEYEIKREDGILKLFNNWGDEFIDNHLEYDWSKISSIGETKEWYGILPGCNFKVYEENREDWEGFHK